MGVEPSKKAFVHYPAGTYPGQNRVLADNTHFNPLIPDNIADPSLSKFGDTYYPVSYTHLVVGIAIYGRNLICRKLVQLEFLCLGGQA